MTNQKKLQVYFPYSSFNILFIYSFIFLTETKSNGNIFGVALSQCVIDDDYRCQDEINPISSTVTTSAGGTNRKTSIDIVGMAANDRRTSPSESVSSTNDSGYSISSASPNSFHVRKIST